MYGQEVRLNIWVWISYEIVFFVVVVVVAIPMAHGNSWARDESMSEL